MLGRLTLVTVLVCLVAASGGSATAVAADGPLHGVLIVSTDGEHLHGAVSEVQPSVPTRPGRGRSLLLLLAVFAVLTVIVGGMQGVRTIFTVTLTAGSVIWILLPALLAGYEAVPTTVAVASLVTVVALGSTAGVSAKTLTAIIGTTGGVVAAGVLAVVASDAAQIVVFELEDIQMLAELPDGTSLDYEGVLFAGMIIGALGAVMDVGMSIASAVAELKRVNPHLGVSELVVSGMNVGRDIMSTMANTLILAYTGGAFPLLLFFMAHGTPLGRIMNAEAVTVEIIRMMAGSVGLVLCIPITALAAGVLIGAGGRRR